MSYWILSKRKLKSMIKEERKSAKEYRMYGLHGIAKDEMKHARMLSLIKR